MRKHFPLIVLAVAVLCSCGTQNNKYITDESISQLKLASVSAFAQAQAQIEIIGSDFRIGSLPEGDVPVCNTPVPRALVKVLGKELAIDLKLATCLAHGRNLKVNTDSDSAFLQEIKTLGVSYDMSSLLYDVACIEALGLKESDWRSGLPFRKGVPTEAIEQSELGAATEVLSKIGVELKDNIDRIKNNLRQSGGDLEMVYGIDAAFKDISQYLETYSKQPDGPVLPYPDFDGIILQHLGNEYLKLIGIELMLNP
jgi:hypothetical protein